MRRRVTIGMLCALAGCGGEARPGEGPRAPDGARRGGTVEVLSFLFPTSMDPGNASNVDAYALLSLVHRSLYTYVGDATEPVPDLAAGPPKLAPDGRAVTVRLRRGVRFAPPVDRPVVAADVRNAIRRAFRRSVGNPYAGDYFAAVRRIETPDDHTLVLRLDRPEARLVSRALAMPVTMPVPEEVSRRTDRRRRSTYEREAVPTGPYRVAEHTTTRIVLERNPAWSRAGDFRAALPDRVVWRAAGDLAVAGRRVARGHGLLLGPGPPPAPDVLRGIARGRYRGQHTPVKAPNFLAFTLNVQRPPLDDVRVRRAVSAAVDRRAILQSIGGPAVGAVATHFIPPGLAGFEEAGGQGGPDAGWVASPEGDPGEVTEQLRAAGRSRRRTALEIAMPKGFPFGVLLQQQLEARGFRVRLTEVGFPSLPRLCTGTRRGAHLCFLSWGADFLDPQPLLAAPFHGRGAGVPGSPNQSGLRDARLDALMAAARAENDPAERARRWAAVDRRVVELAAAVPVAWQASPLLHSRDVVSTGNRWLGFWDLNLTGLRSS